MSDMTTVVPPEVEVGRGPIKPVDQCTAAELRSAADHYRLAAVSSEADATQASREEHLDAADELNAEAARKTRDRLRGNELATSR